MLKLTVLVCAFLATLTLGLSVLANESEGHHKGPLFPQPEADASKSTRPGMPELMEPSFMAKVSAGGTVLKWNPVNSADFYTVQVATDPNFKWLVAEDKMHKTTSFEVKSLETGKHYYWRVFAGKSSNDPGRTRSLGSKSMFEAQ